MSGTVSTGTVIPYQSHLDPDEKVDLAKKRKKYMLGIRKWDYYSLRNNPDEALALYLQTLEKIPDDQVVKKKIWHVYFLMQNWKSAYEYFIQVPIWELSDTEKKEMMQSLFFDESQMDRIGELNKIPFGTGVSEYYKAIDTCYTGIHNCVIRIESYTGTSLEMQTLQSSLTGASLISPDSQYRNLVLAAKLYEQGMYGASSRIALEILSNKPDYLEAQKILWFSLSKLGKYTDAKKYLLQYLEKNTSDLESIIEMGHIYSALGDIASSNLSLNNAILSGYTPKTDIERKLAYNYSLLGDISSLLKVMNYLLQEADATEDDFAVGVSMALSEWDTDRAHSWAQTGIQKYPDSLILIPLAAESMRLSGDRDGAVSLLDSVSEDKKILNPHIALERAIIDFDLQNYDDARQIFEELSTLSDEWPSVAEEANAYLATLTTLTSTGVIQ